jgi:hypothetical protein
MAHRHFENNPPEFLLKLSRYLEDNGWEIDWTKGSGPDYTNFINGDSYLQYSWAIGNIYVRGQTPPGVFRNNNLEDVMTWLNGLKPKILDMPNDYCDYGQVVGEETEDEFGVYCSYKGTKSVSANSRTIFLCDLHMESYENSGFPMLPLYKDYFNEEDEDNTRETCPNCGEYIDDCACCPECGSNDCRYCDKCEHSGCSCTCCEECKQNPCECCSECGNYPCNCPSE